MTPEQTAAAAKNAVLALGSAFNHDPRTMRRARQLGLTGWAFYVAGRAGAMGDVGADTAAAAMAFVAADAVRDGWETAGRVAPPRKIAGYHIAECCRWGRENLESFYGLSRLVELTERVAVHADPTGMPLFAAWRAMPVPDTAPAARAAVLLHLLHEHRGAAHIQAVRASALTPLEAIVAGPDGESGATALGWLPPYPPCAPLLRKRAWAEALTDRIAGEAYRALEPDQRQELVDLLDAARQLHKDRQNDRHPHLPIRSGRTYDWAANRGPEFR
ncbi:SCO6745 family protein [Planosporangium sp. 12N6]|uniref:SCO6745 family protein n=1 Tax=Planosporangium spinosum TaxID=3402278 RepID=UPI003CE74300